MDNSKSEGEPNIPVVDFRRYDSVKVEHIHDYYQLVLPYSGRMEIEVGGKSSIIDQNQGAFVGINVRHEFASVDNGTFIVLDVTKSQLFNAYFLLNSDEHLRDQVFFPINDQIKLLASYAIAKSTTIEQEMITKAWVTLIISEIVDYTKSDLSPKARVIHRAIDYIDNNFSRKITIASIAKEVGVSERSLYVFFVDCLKTTPHAYVIKKRVEHAMLLLRSTQKSVPEIAFLSGYIDQNALSRGMQKLYGITPAGYRQKTRQNSPG